MKLLSSCIAAALLLVNTEGHELVSPAKLRGSNGISDVSNGVDVMSLSEEEYRKLHRLSLDEKVKGDCKDPISIPFMITNLEGAHDGDQLRLSWYSWRDPVSIYFLKDVKYCPTEYDFLTGIITTSPYVVFGTKITKDKFKSEVKNYLESSGLEKVLYGLHGFSVEPKSMFMEAYDFNLTEKGTGFLVIPVSWRSQWEIPAVTYVVDREKLAVLAGKLYAKNSDIFDTDYPAPITMHSMGNFVFRLMAGDIPSPKQYFEAIFMVAADIRSDVFSDEANPDAPRTEEEHAQEALVTADFFTPPKEVLEPNGGYDISKLGGHVHVTWNKDDFAFSTAKWFALGNWPEKMRQALGGWGDKAESYMQLQYFKDKVTFYDFTSNTHGFIQHSYSWEDPAVELYVKHGNPPSTPRTKVKSCRWTGCNSGGCSMGEVEEDKKRCWWVNNEKCCKWVSSYAQGVDHVSNEDGITSTV